MSSPIPATDSAAAPAALLAITDKAREKILALLGTQEPRPTGLRVSIQGGGCSRFQYKFDFESQAQPFDQVIREDGFGVFVDNISACYLAGSELDYVSTLMTEGFHVRNPNARGTCGCGLSVKL